MLKKYYYKNVSMFLLVPSVFFFFFSFLVEMQCSFTTRQVLVKAVNNHLSHFALVQFFFFFFGSMQCLIVCFYFVGAILIPRTYSNKNEAEMIPRAGFCGVNFIFNFQFRYLR